jgi:hypothetical protein
MFGSNVQTPTTNGGVPFYWFLHGFGNVTTTASPFQTTTFVMPSACTFNSLRVAHQANSGANNLTYSYFLVKMSANVPTNTALTCSLTTSAGNTQTCSDGSNTVAAAAGDQFAFGAVTASNSTRPAGRILVSARCQ